MKLSNLTKRFLSSILLLPTVLFLIFYNKITFLLLIVFVLFVSIFELYKINKSKNLFLSLLSYSIIILSIISAYQLRGESLESKLFFIWLISVCFSSDIGGYFVGKFYGKHNITRISPNKTYEGLIGSFVFSLLPIIIFSIFFNQFQLFNLSLKNILLSLLFSFFCQIGDLFFSYIKRINNTKDFGSILPGHGGLLDRIDGVLFVMIISIILNKFNLI